MDLTENCIEWHGTERDVLYTLGFQAMYTRSIQFFEKVLGVWCVVGTMVFNIDVGCVSADVR